MGYEQVENITYLNFNNLQGGWFPGKHFNDIPGNYANPTEILGFRDCDHVIYYEGALRKMFGFDNVNTTALNAGATVTSIFYSQVLDNVLVTAGNKLYKDGDTAAPTDITGSLTITADKQVSWVDWQFDTTRLAIGANGVDTPWKYDGSTSSVIGGSPPAGKWIQVLNQVVWIANTSSKPGRIQFSNIGDPDVWDSNDYYDFTQEITGLGILNGQLIVFQENQIGMLIGDNPRLMTVIDSYVKGVGCNGGHTIANGTLADKNVLFFHGQNGIYAFDGSPNVIKLSTPIDRKYINAGTTVLWNSSRFPFAWGTYNESFGWYILSLSDGGDTTNDFVLILDTNTLKQTRTGQLYVPHWPLDGIDANCIVSIRKTNEKIYFGGTDGFVYAFNEGVFNHNGSTYTAYADTKVFDPGQTTLVREINVTGDAESATVDVSINYDLQSGVGETGTIDLADTSAVFPITLDSDTLGGKEFSFENVPVTNFGRFFWVRLQNDTVDESPAIYSLNLILKNLGLRDNIA